MGKLIFHNADAATPAPETNNQPNQNSDATTNQNRKNMPIDPQLIDTILTTGAQVGTTVAKQRQASGKSAERQARIAACGRKPLFGKKKKADYEKCVAAAQGGGQQRSADIPDGNSSGGDGEDNKTMLYVGIGLGVVVLGVVGFILYKKFSK